MRDSLLLYRSQLEALLTLDGDNLKESLKAIVGYALDDIMPDCEGLPLAMFTMAKPLIDKNNRNYLNGKSGGRPKPTDNRPITEPKPTDNRTITDHEPNHNPKEKGERLKDKGEINQKSIGRFTPPTAQQVREYAAEKGYILDADRFVDFYESKGWMVGKNKMKDWKAAVRNWARSQRQEATAKGRPASKFTDFPQRNIDIKSLEKALLDGSYREGQA